MNLEKSLKRLKLVIRIKKDNDVVKKRLKENFNSNNCYKKEDVIKIREPENLEAKI